MIEVEEGRSSWTLRCIEVPSRRIANILAGIAVAGGLAFFGLRLVLRSANWDWQLGVGIVLVCAVLVGMVLLRSPVTGVVAIFDLRTRLVQITTHRGRASESATVAFDDVAGVDLAASGRDQVVEATLKRPGQGAILLGRVRVSGDIEPVIATLSEKVRGVAGGNGPCRYQRDASSRGGLTLF